MSPTKAGTSTSVESRLNAPVPRLTDPGPIDLVGSSGTLTSIVCAEPTGEVLLALSVAVTVIVSGPGGRLSEFMAQVVDAEHCSEFSTCGHAVMGYCAGGCS